MRFLLAETSPSLGDLAILGTYAVALIVGAVGWHRLVTVSERQRADRAEAALEAERKARDAAVEAERTKRDALSEKMFPLLERLPSTFAEMSVEIRALLKDVGVFIARSSGRHPS